MNFVGYVACYLAILLNSYVLFWCYFKTGVERKTSKLKCLLSILTVSLSVFVVNMFITKSLKFILIYIIMCLFFYYNFGEKNKIIALFVRTLIIYVVMIISDVFSSIILMQFDFSSMMNKINYLKALGTLLNSVSMFILFNLDKLVIIIKKILTIIVSSKNSVVFTFCFLLFDFYSYNNY